MNRVMIATKPRRTRAPTISSTSDGYPRADESPDPASGAAMLAPGRCPIGVARLPARLVEPLEAFVVPRILRREAATGEDEQHKADRDEHAHERVDLAPTGQEEREHGENDADPVDQQDGLAVRQPDVEQPVVEVAAIGRERRATLGQPPDDDPEGV